LKENFMRTIQLTLILALAAVCTMPAQTDKQDEQRSRAKVVKVTGCLAKGDSAEEYRIAESGKTYALSSSSGVNMAEHVGHKVTVTGAPATAASETEQAEHLNVTDLKMVSTTCP
jgi:hypothetical protein